MPSTKHLPPVAVAVAVGRLLSGRIRFPKDRVGKLLTMEDGEAHFVFSDVRFASSRSLPAESMTVLRVHSKFDRYPHAINRRLFLIPIPIITGMPGFRRKIWTFCEKSGYYQGIYQFESMELAEGYRRSLLMRVLEKRSVPGSTSFELLPATLIEDYLDKRSRF